MTQAKTAADADTIFGFDVRKLGATSQLTDREASVADRDLLDFLTGAKQEVPSGIDKFRNMSETDVAKSVKLLREKQKDKDSTITNLLELVHLMNSVAKAQSLEQSILRQVNGVSYALASYNSGMDKVMQVMNSNEAMKDCLEKQRVEPNKGNINVSSSSQPRLGSTSNPNLASQKKSRVAESKSTGTGLFLFC
jgi:hypothetical protein